MTEPRGLFREAQTEFSVWAGKKPEDLSLVKHLPRMPCPGSDLFGCKKLRGLHNTTEKYDLIVANVAYLCLPNKQASCSLCTQDVTSLAACAHWLKAVPQMDFLCLLATCGG